jgi:hypothetical protein
MEFKDEYHEALDDLSRFAREMIAVIALEKAGDWHAIRQRWGSDDGIRHMFDTAKQLLDSAEKARMRVG